MIRAIAAGFAVIALAAFPAPSRAGASAPSGAGAQLLRGFLMGTSYLSGEERDMRHCSRPYVAISCDTAISGIHTSALLWSSFVQRVPTTALSLVGLRIRANVLEEFRRYDLAATSFSAGAFSAYIGNLRQAIIQGAAASTRFGDRPYFNYLMAVAECGAWSIKIRLLGENPCD